MFKASWEASFSKKNITSAFAKTGIFPHKPSVVLDKIKRPESELAPISEERTPMTCRSIRRVQKAYKKSPTVKRLSLIFRANCGLAAQHSIDQYTITGLISALKQEKKKRSRGKRLNLVGEVDNGPQFYSPSQVHCAKDYSEEIKAQEQVERDRIDNKKAATLANRIRKEEEKAARALQASIRKQEVTQKKLQKAAEIQARKDQREAAKQAHEAQKAQKCTEKAAPRPKDAAIARHQSSVVAKVVYSRRPKLSLQGQEQQHDPQNGLVEILSTYYLNIMSNIMCY
jgi:hypothetical protein